MNTIELQKYDSISVRVKPGSYITFPIVDNKGLFPQYISGTDFADSYLLETFYGEDLNTYGIYKVQSGLKFLICAFTCQEEINDHAMNAIFNHFTFIIDKLKIKTNFEMNLNVSELPYYDYELAVKVGDKYYRKFKIKDPQNLSNEELKEINDFPRALEVVNKYNNYITEMTERAFLKNK
ncbi:hypothetical protein [Klebsiella oxytoca]|uniref:hypothetical protein n=1 Tax=Klebsiella oxytoca TaxID=571 RepID=UPI0022461C19|nr:hypothetical protein [Klebsiella oxytoca]MCW9549663.1 hypothetical protein [Klebsiella oxytoca]